VQRDLQAAALVHAQHQRARALVVAQPGVAGTGGTRGVDGDDVAPERVQHPGRHVGAEAVEHIGLFERHDLGAHGRGLAAGRRAGGGGSGLLARLDRRDAGAAARQQGQGTQGRDQTGAQAVRPPAKPTGATAGSHG
jgi:hypothetical protein